MLTHQKITRRLIWVTKSVAMIFWKFSSVHICVQREQKTKIKKRLQLGEHVSLKLGI